MTEATLTVKFDVATPEGRDDMAVFLSARELLHTIRSLDLWLRNQVKHSQRPEAAIDALQEARDQLRAEMPPHLMEAL